MEKSVFLGKESLLEMDDLKIVKVELTRGHVFVREMTGHEKDLWEASMIKQKGGFNKDGKIEYETSLEDFRAKLAVCTVCDADGKLLFEPRDAKALNLKMSAANIEKIVNAAQKLNAITEKDREDIIKNSETDQESGSNSGSVVN